VIIIEPHSLNTLRKQAIIRFGLAELVIPAILFSLAGTLHYWQGLLSWADLIITMIVRATSTLEKHLEHLIE
jgi:hypothetical protein